MPSRPACIPHTRSHRTSFTTMFTAWGSKDMTCAMAHVSNRTQPMLKSVLINQNQGADSHYDSHTRPLRISPSKTGKSIRVLPVSILQISLWVKPDLMPVRTASFNMSLVRPDLPLSPRPQSSGTYTGLTYAFAFRIPATSATSQNSQQTISCPCRPRCTPLVRCTPRFRLG
jgi:hypothetical protein